MQQNKYKQASKEARWALYLTIIYLIAWFYFAYNFKNTPGLLGFPLWFELSCIMLPIVFIICAYIIIKLIYKDIDINNP